MLNNNVRIQLTLVIGLVSSAFSYVQTYNYIDRNTISENPFDFNTNKAAQDWVLVFSDEFLGTSLNTSNWEYQTGCDATYGVGNLQCYVAGTNNIQVANGILTLTSKIQNMQSKNFTSGRIRQLGTGIVYGRFVIRARVPVGKSLWPALWLKSKLTSCYQEIDTLEMEGDDPTRLIFTAWSGLNAANVVKQGVANKTTIDFSQDFHNYEVVWDSTQVSWLVDGVLYFKVLLSSPVWTNGPTQPCPLGVLTQPQNIILNLAVGGSMFNYPPITPADALQSWTKLTLEVDYVQVYQLQ